MNISEVQTNRGAKWISMLLLAFLPCLSACTDTEWPFDVQKAGNKIEVEYRAMEHRGYYFNLQFMYKKGDEVDRKRIWKLLGGSTRDNNGKLVEPGVPILLRFKINIIDAAGERPMLEQDIPVLGITSWGADSLDRQITMVILQPGLYRISVENLKDVPELVGIPVIFSIRINPKIQPIS